MHDEKPRIPVLSGDRLDLTLVLGADRRVVRSLARIFLGFAKLPKH